jgi:hypothetical protein
MHFHQTPNPPLEILLPKLRAAFLHDGLSEEVTESFLIAIRLRRAQPALETGEQYREAWTAAQAAMGVMTCNQDNSEAAKWLRDITDAIFAYEDTYEVAHGHRPLNPGPPEWTDGPVGTA